MTYKTEVDNLVNRYIFVETVGNDRQRKMEGKDEEGEEEENVVMSAIFCSNRDNF